MHGNIHSERICLTLNWKNSKKPEKMKTVHKENKNFYIPSIFGLQVVQQRLTYCVFVQANAQ